MSSNRVFLPADRGGRHGGGWRLPVLLPLPFLPLDPGKLKVDNLGFGLQFLALPVALLNGASVVARFRRPALALHLGRNGSLLRFWLAVDPLRLKAAVVDALDLPARSSARFW